MKSLIERGEGVYISVSEAAKKFNISNRRVQILCEQGRIVGAIRMSGVWLIPEEAQKPADARVKRDQKNSSYIMPNLFNEISSESMSIEQVCEALSISQATVKNWIRLGKIKTEANGETFSKAYIEELYKEIKYGTDSRLKSRRNKKSISGKVVYKDYIKSEKNQAVVEQILNSYNEISEDELKILLAHFAVQLYQNNRNIIASGNCLDNDFIKEHSDCVFVNLIKDLLGDISVSDFDLSYIAPILNYQVEYVPFEDTLGFVYISLRDLSKRKQTGAYYTPLKTVDVLIQRLSNCVKLDGATVCDPCCGTGNFLIGLAGNGVGVEKLYGQDIDPLSIFITRINMYLLDENISLEKLYSQFVCKNTLEASFDKKFSIVLGNPPWGYAFSREEIKYLEQNYITAKNKSVESYDLFVEKGLSMLEEEGYLAYVLPEAVLSVASHQKVRELIISTTAFKFVRYLGNSFSNVQCPAIILGVKKGDNGQTKGCVIGFDNEEFIIGKERKMDSSLFAFNMSDEEYDCLYAISSINGAEYLANNAKFALGIVTGNNKEYIKDTKEDNFEIVLKGSDICRYAIKDSNNYIHFVPENFQQVAPSEMYRAKEKLIYRFISEVPVFAYDDNQTLSLNSCNILIPQIAGLEMKYVLAILNSSVAAFYLDKKFRSIKVLRSHIESLPIPVVDKKEQIEMMKKVDQIMNSNEDIIGLYEELDNMIMNLYSLSENQKEIIRRALQGKNLFLRE